MEIHKNKTMKTNIPSGNTKENIKARKGIIIRFYQNWKQNNPTLRKYNLNLKDYINIRNISMTETAAHASKRYLSTLAVLQLDTILVNAQKIKTEITKQKTNNQNAFERMIIMGYSLPGIGKVNLVVGVKGSNRAKVQYCITAIETK